MHSTTTYSQSDVHVTCTTFFSPGGKKTDFTSNELIRLQASHKVCSTEIWLAELTFPMKEN